MKRINSGLIGLSLMLFIVCASDNQSFGANPSILASLLPGVRADEQSEMINGAVLGAYLGTFAAFYPALAEGAGNGSSSAVPWIGVGFGLGAVLGAAAGYAIERQWPSAPTSIKCSAYNLVDPCPHQFQIQVENMSGFTLPGSVVNVREFQLLGSRLGFNRIGLGTEQVPGIDAYYWFNGLNAVHFRFRYFDLGGSWFSTQPFHFNGARVKPGPLDTTPFPWFAGGLYYERRFAPWYRRYETFWPTFLKGWDFRGRLGLEYNYIYFTFDHGHPPVEPHSGTEGAEDFYHQSMPLPTLGLTGYRRLGEHFTLEASAEGYWLNRLNSLRDEGGIVWASHYGGEVHTRLYYGNPGWLGPVQLMVGAYAYHYTQLERSTEDGNYLHWSMAGLEYGLVCVL